MDYFRRRYNTPGSIPGLPSMPEGELAGRARIQRLCYNADRFDYHAHGSLRHVRHAPADQKLWLDVSGEPSARLLRRLGERFGLHTLALEDVAHRGQRPKVEPFPDHVFVILNMPDWQEGTLAIRQISLFLGPRFVISVHPFTSDIFQPVRARLEASPGGRIRAGGTDYLLYALMDLVVDHNFPVLETYSEQLQDIESILITDTAATLRERIHETQRQLLFLRRALWSQREAIGTLLDEDMPLISGETQLFLRDCHDHAVHALEMGESYRDVGTALVEMQMTNINQRTQESLRTLTVIATIFMPLTFITGLYGMNFDTRSVWNMPELGWRYGYLFVWGMIAVTVTGMIVYFKRRGLW